MNSDPSSRVGSDSYEVSLLTVLGALLRRWKLVILLPLVLASVVVASRLLSEREYAAQSQFMPQSPDQRSRLPGLAAQLGIVPPTAGAADSPEFYHSLITSPDLLRQVATSTYTIIDEVTGQRRETTLVELFGDPEEPEAERLGAAVKQLEGQITVSLDRSAGLVTVEARSTQPELAAQINRRVLELVGDFNVERRQTHARAEREFVADQMVAAQRNLEAAERELENFLEQNRRFAESPSLRFEVARLERRIALRQEIALALSQSFEQARLEEVRNTPVISVIRQPEFSVQPVGRRTVLSGLIALFAGLIFGVVLALAMEYFAEHRRENPQGYAALTGRKRSAAGRARPGEEPGTVSHTDQGEVVETVPVADGSGVA